MTRIWTFFFESLKTANSMRETKTDPKLTEIKMCNISYGSDRHFQNCSLILKGKIGDKINTKQRALPGSKKALLNNRNYING